MRMRLLMRSRTGLNLAQLPSEGETTRPSSPAIETTAVSPPVNLRGRTLPDLRLPPGELTQQVVVDPGRPGPLVRVTAARFHICAALVCERPQQSSRGCRGCIDALRIGLRHAARVEADALRTTRPRLSAHVRGRARRPWCAPGPKSGPTRCSARAHIRRWQPQTHQSQTCRVGRGTLLRLGWSY